MSDGQKAAESTKNLFRSAGDATESLRQNINSFADNLLGNKEHGSGRVHPDAKATGNEAAHLADKASQKMGSHDNNTRTSGV